MQWDRQVYLWLDDAGSPTTIKKLDTIERNMFISDYHSMEGARHPRYGALYPPRLRARSRRPLSTARARAPLPPPHRRRQ